MRGVWVLVLCAWLCACSADIRPSSERGYGSEDIIYQFIDAETMKPIAGAYVNPVWVTPTPPGKVNGSRCVQAALLRSDDQGWVRMKAPKGSILDNNTMMVPGYEFMDYRYKVPDDRHVVHYIDGHQQTVEHYPAWAAALERLGYRRGKVPGLDGVKYYKQFPIAGFVDPLGPNATIKKFLVTYRSFPSSGRDSITQVAKACGPEGVNIGLDDAARAETGIRRALLLLGLVCDEKWDTATGVLPQHYLMNPLWLVKLPGEGNDAWEQFTRAVPTYPKNGLIQPFTREQRLEFCAWMRPYAEKVK